MLSKVEFEKLESELYERIKTALLKQFDNLIEDRKKNDRENSERNDLDHVLTGEEAKRFYNQIRNPAPNAKSSAILKKAVKLFPDPDKPTELPIDL